MDDLVGKCWESWKPTRVEAFQDVARALESLGMADRIGEITVQPLPPPYGFVAQSPTIEARE